MTEQVSAEHYTEPTSSNTYGSRNNTLSDNEHYRYMDRRESENGRGRGRGRSSTRGRGGGFRKTFRPMRNNFILDFNRFAEYKPEIHKRVIENFEHRMNSGDTKELFHWASPPLNDFRVGNTVFVRFLNETEMHQYMVTAKFMRGECNWKHPMPDGVRYEFRLKKLD